MTPEKEQQLAQHLKAVATILYEETEPEQVETLAKIEATVREQTLQYITPQLGVFLSNKPPKHKQGELET